MFRWQGSSLSCLYLHIHFACLYLSSLHSDHHALLRQGALRRPYPGGPGGYGGGLLGRGGRGAGRRGRGGGAGRNPAERRPPPGTPGESSGLQVTQRIANMQAQVHACQALWSFDQTAVLSLYYWFLHALDPLHLEYQFTSSGPCLHPNRLSYCLAAKHHVMHLLIVSHTCTYNCCSLIKRLPCAKHSSGKWYQIGSFWAVAAIVCGKWAAQAT